MKGFLFLVAICISSLSFGQKITSCNPVKAINLRVVNSALSQIGKKIDRGECWDLIAYALNESQAKWTAPSKFGVKYNPAKECVSPGDILSFSNVKFVGVSEGYSYNISMMKHYAIVKEVLSEDEISILHQNYGSTKNVVPTILKLSDLRKGKITYFKPQEK